MCSAKPCRNQASPSKTWVSRIPAGGAQTITISGANAGGVFYEVGPGPGGLTRALLAGYLAGFGLSSGRFL